MAAVAREPSVRVVDLVPRYVFAALRLQTASYDRTNRSGRHPDCPSKKSPARESGAFDLGWNGDDYTGHLALAAVSAATVTATAAVSTAGMSTARVSATVRTAQAPMRRESARLPAAAAAETTSARRA
jgi:hypothetical protein